MADRRTPNQHRWGMLGTTHEAAAVPPQKQMMSRDLKWEDFDHTKTLKLGFSGSTSIIFTRQPLDKYNCAVLRFCDEVAFTAEKRRLVETALAETALANERFLTVLCSFSYNQKIFVVSELADISLADIIDCTIPLQEIQLATILDQVSF
jgi:hypothetical protein